MVNQSFLTTFLFVIFIIFTIGDNVLERLQEADLSFGKVIGEGGQGTVYDGLWRGNVPVAIKTLNDSSSKNCSELKLSKLTQANIVTIFGYVEKPNTLLIVMELCTKGSLRTYLEEHKDTPLSTDLIFDWSLQASRPIKYLREQNISHRDIKTDNYIITDRMVLKLTDFGIAKSLEKTVSCSRETGTWRWMAPEVLKELKLSPTYDIFSLALVIWSIVTRKLPFEEIVIPFDLGNAIINGQRPKTDCSAFQFTQCSKTNEDFIFLIEKCWSADRNKRPDITWVVAEITRLQQVSFNSLFVYALNSFKSRHK